MNTRLIHTPDGVRDVYGEEYVRKHIITKKLEDIIGLYGYESISTPTIEYYRVFRAGKEEEASREYYKFIDKNGDTLVLRPDYTPSIARCVGKYFEDCKEPLRFTYTGSRFKNTSILQGKLNESDQIGIELIGDDSVRADGEVISLIVDSLKTAGLKDFQVSIGNVDFFRGVCSELGLSEEEREELREYIINKNIFGAIEYLNGLGIAYEVVDKLMQIWNSIGGVEVLVVAKELVKDEMSIQALNKLNQLYEVLKIYGVDSYVSFDLGLLSNHDYYTGNIFKAYTYGVGDAIVKGGRYDDFLKTFGKDRAAIGFCISVDDLMQAIDGQNIAIDMPRDIITLYYTEDNYNDVVSEARRRRSNGERIRVLRRMCIG